MTEPSDAELERGVLDAMALASRGMTGADEIARTLAARLEDRRRARAGDNVVPMVARRSIKT